MTHDDEADIDMLVREIVRMLEPETFAVQILAAAHVLLKVIHATCDAGQMHVADQTIGEAMRIAERLKQ
jgi:hypothetical protein